MGLILDLAVIVLAGLVIVSLATLAWTLGVSLVTAASEAREQVAAARASVTRAEERIHALATSGDDRDR